MRFLLSTLLTIGFLASAVIAQDRVQIVSPQTLDGPAAYGIARLTKAISDRGVAVSPVKTVEQVGSSHVIVAGFSTQPRVADVITASGLALPERPESLAVCRIRDTDRSTIVLCGSDAVGLMYAALDTASRTRSNTCGSARVARTLVPFSTRRATISAT